MLPPNAGPWHGREVSAVALPAPSLLLLLTSKPPQLFAVPLNAPPRILSVLRPTSLGGRAGHTSVRAAAFHAASATLVVAGDAGRSGGEIGAGPTVSVSAWRLEISGSGSDCKAELKGAYVGPLQAAGGSGSTRGPATPAPVRWSLAVSPLGEQAALCVPPAGGLLLLSLPQCSRLQLGLQASPGDLSACAASAVSGCWWSSEAALALSDTRGRVALAQLPGLGADLLLLGPQDEEGEGEGREGQRDEGGAAQGVGAQEHGVVFAPGTVVAAKVGGPGPRGLLVLEPVAAGGAAAGGSRLGGGPAAGGAAAAPSLRLLLLAERTAQEMMQLHVRHQRWAAALRLAAAAGLDADAVYAARWAASAVDGGGEAVAANLERVRDRRWVVGECLSRLAVDAAGQRLLLRYGLAESEAQERAQSDGGSGDNGGGGGSAAAPWWWWRLARLRLLRHLDRLELLLAAQGGAYAAAAYAAFRDLPLAAAAGSWAALGGVGPLTALAAAYPAALSPAAPGPLLLGVLSRLPETLSPRLYGALLPRADGTEAAATPPAPRAADWAEAPEQLAALHEALAAVQQAGGELQEAPGGGPLPGGVEVDMTDATWRALAPPARLSAGAVCEWYCERALQLDEATGQMQASLALLELGWERGGRSPRLAQLLGAARALAGVMTAASTARQCTSGPAAAAPHSSQRQRQPPSVWLLGLRGFLALPGGEQLRLLLGGSSEDSLRRDVRERVLPFLRGPGVSAADAAALAAALLAEEVRRRPGWAAALCESEAEAMSKSTSRQASLFRSATQLVQALCKSVMECHHTDEWPALQRAMAAAGAALAAERSSASGEELELELADEAAAAEALLSRLAGAVAAAELLAAHGLPLTVRHVSTCREGAQEAARCVRQVLGRVQRSSASQPDAQWAALWRDLAAVRAAAFTCLTPEQVLSELCRCMLHCGRTDLANAYLRGGAPRVPVALGCIMKASTSHAGGEDGQENVDEDESEQRAAVVSLTDEAADALLASVAAELLAAANDPWDSSAQQAAACLALAGDECAAAQGLQRLVAALELLPDFGIELLPAQVLQMPDRFEVVRLALAAQEQAEAEERRGSAAAGLAPGLVAVLTGVGKAAAGQAGAKGLGAAALGGRGSRRRAAVEAAGRAAAVGGRAAAALAGGLLAVAGRVAPNVAGAVAVAGGAVADRVAGMVAAAAEGEAGRVSPEDVSNGHRAGGHGAHTHVPVGRLLELSELLGLTSTADELRVRELAARSALRSGDVATAQHLALGLMAVQHTPGWSLCADLGPHKQLPGGDGVRRRLLSYAALHCPPARMPLLLEELREVERRLEPGTGGEATTAHTDTESQLRQAIAVTQPAGGRGIMTGGASVSADLPSLGDALLALAVLQPMAAKAGGAATDPEAQKGLQLLGALAASRHGGDDHRPPYAQVQRALALQCFCHCLSAIAAGGGCSPPQQRLQLLRRPLAELLMEARQAHAGGGATVAATPVGAAAAAALAADSALAAARDSRAVRRAVPGVDVGQFAAGDVQYRREAILRQASLAGAAEAEALVGSGPSGSSPSSTSGPPSPTPAASASRPAAPDLGSAPPQAGPPPVLAGALADAASSARGAELLAATARLAAAYGVEGWELRLAFTTSLLTSAPAVTPELRAAVSRAAAPLLASEHTATALLGQLVAAAYPALPPASGPHLAAWVALLVECLGAVGRLAPGAGGQDAATTAALASAACPALDKLRELLERAAGALKGLALTTLLAPLLSAVLQPLGLSLQPLAAAAAAAAAAPLETAAAAMFTYVKPANIPQAAKLVAALHKLLGPLGRKAPLPQLQPALDALSPSLPYLCLCVKAVSVKAQQRGSADGNAAAAPPPQRDMAAAWGHIAEQVVRLPPPQLTAWLAFALLPGTGPGLDYCCPLPPAVTGCPLQPVPMPRLVQTEVLDACMPLLAAADSAAPGALPGVDLAGRLAELRELHRRLRLLRAARQQATAAAEGNVLTEEQVQRLDSDLFPVASSGSTDAAADLADSGRRQSALEHLAVAGCPFAVLLGLAAAAADGASPAPADTAAAAVRRALQAALGVMDGPSAAPSGPRAGPAGEALQQLRGLVRCLDVQPVAVQVCASAAEVVDAASAAAVSAHVVSEQVAALREEVWSALQQATDQLHAATAAADPSHGGSLVATLLDLQATLGAEVWSDWGGGASIGDGGNGRSEHLRRLLLLTRTRALLAHLPPLRPEPATGAAGAGGPGPVAVQPPDVESCEAAEALLVRLLGAPADDAQSALPPPQPLKRLELLSRLVEDVWQGGHAWGQSASQGNHSSATAVSPLRGCWRALALAHLRSGHLLEAARLVDPPLPAGQRLSESDVDDLLLHCPANTAAAGPWARWVLGLSSPYPAHRQRALAELQQQQQQQEAASGAALPPASELEALLLLALLARCGDAAALATGAPATRLLASLLRQLPAVDHTKGARSCSAVALLAVVPCLAAHLVKQGQAALAAALAARWLRLHPSLAASGGSSVVLELCFRKAAAAADSTLLGLSGEVVEAAGWPGSVVWAVRQRVGACRGALQDMAAGAQQLPLSLAAEDATS